MGFQFNHVGGGTKTRRPITLHMKYNSACVQPVCFLLTEEFGEQEVSLEEVQVGGAGGRAGRRRAGGRRAKATGPASFAGTAAGSRRGGRGALC